LVRKLSDVLKKQYLWIVLIIGMIHGFLYLVLIPPWQHYDEPGHFEYAWMIANHNRIPQKGEYDNLIRSEILASMKRNDFFKHQNIEYLLESVDQIDPVWIGISQVGDPSLYYVLTSLPLRILKNQSIENQLYATRFVSLVLYLLILVTAVFFAKEIFPPHHAGRILFPLTLCLVPSFVDHMTALNNDVAAVLINSLILLFGIRLIKHGLNWRDGLLLMVFGSLVFFVKASIWLSIILVIMAFVFSLRKRIRRFALGISIVLITIFIVSIFQVKDAALWYKNSIQISPTEIHTIYGNAFYLTNDPNYQISSLIQTVPPKDYDSLAGKVVTLSAEIWGDTTYEFVPMTLKVLTNNNEILILPAKSLLIPSTPEFFVNHIQLPEDFNLLFVELQNFSYGEIFIKNPILVVGEYPTNIEPDYIDKKNRTDKWNGSEFRNLIRNGSATRKWISFRPEFKKLMETIDPRLSGAANKIIYSLDLKGTGWYLKASAERIFRTFWAVFGWGNVFLYGDRSYLIVLVFTIISLMMSMNILIKQRSNINFYLIFWFGLAILFSGGFAWFTGVSMNSLFINAYLPVARFIFPAIFPILLFIIYGWSNYLSKLKYKSIHLGSVIYFIFFLYLDIISIFSILRYF
jgi:hypothetical protein